MQITHVLGERMKELVEEAEREKALKDVANAMAWGKGKAVEVVEKKARLLAKRKLVDMEAKLVEIELKLAQTEILNLAHVDEVADLKAALEACEDKWYNEGFADAENSVEPVVHQVRVQGFEEGWLVTFQALGVPKDSPLRNPNQIPRSAIALPIQSQADTIDEEDTPSIRELVQAIDTHVETVDLEVTSNLNAPKNEEGQQPSAEDVQDQHTYDAAHFFPTDPAT